MAEQAILPGANVGRDPVYNRHKAPDHGLPGRAAGTADPSANPGSGQGSGQDANVTAFGKDGFGFSDVLDMINPLQHIPVVGEAYRAITGDEMAAVPRMVGGAVFGGPVGLAGATANVAIKSATGDDIGGHMMALATGDEESAGTEVAATGPKPGGETASTGGEAENPGDSSKGRYDYMAAVQQANRLLAATPPPEVVASTQGQGGTAQHPTAGPAAAPGRPTGPAEQQAAAGGSAPTATSRQAMYQRPDGAMRRAAAAAAQRYPDGLPAEEKAARDSGGNAEAPAARGNRAEKGGDHPLLAAQSEKGKAHPMVGGEGRPRGGFADTVMRNLEKYRAMAERGAPNRQADTRDDRS